MADFRRCIFALAVVALLTGMVSTASAQLNPTGPFSCNATAAVPTLMRSEGLTELAGDIVLQCAGILPAGSLNSANISVFLGNTTITSRILDATTGASEVLLLIDEPTALTIDTVDPGKNTFQGIISGNQVQFLGIPVVPTASVGASVAQRIFRITNIRANASAVGTGAAGTPGQVTAFVSIAGPTSIPVNNAQQTVGFVSRGLDFSVRNAVTGTNVADQEGTGTRGIGDLTFAQCVARGTGTGAQQTPVAALRFRENFATAFKVRGDSTQTTPGAIYNTESGLVVTGITSITGALVPGTAGLADTGTKLRAVFNNMPNGLRVFVSNSNIRAAVPATGVAAATLQASLLTSQTAPTGSFAVPTNTFDPGGSGRTIPVTQLTVTAGTAEAVWEVTAASPTVQEFADFWLFIGYAANPAANSPATGTGTVAGTFAPVSTVTTASATAPIPRFADTGSAINVVAIVACRTNLLFPFVTNQVGFDTGLAIANTSRDIFGTSAQAGTCALNFFGANAPAAVTTASIAGGDTYVALAQTIAPNFQGYIIAQCGFQFGHGFAFVSDVGARNLAMGYLALVIPDQVDNTRARNAINVTGNGELLGQ